MTLAWNYLRVNYLMYTCTSWCSVYILYSTTAIVAVSYLLIFGLAILAVMSSLIFVHSYKNISLCFYAFTDTISWAITWANIDSDMAPLGCILFKFVSDVLLIKDHRYRFTLRESNMIMMKIPRFQLCGKPYVFFWQYIEQRQKYVLSF